MEMIEVKTADLIGPALDWAVAQVEGVNYRQDGIKCKTRIAPRKLHHYTEPNFSPSTDWSWGGPLIEKFILDLKFCVFELPNESWEAETHESWANGSTALIASMRAIVHANFGDTVSVPKELMQ